MRMSHAGNTMIHRTRLMMLEVYMSSDDAMLVMMIGVAAMMMMSTHIPNPCTH